MEGCDLAVLERCQPRSLRREPRQVRAQYGGYCAYAASQGRIATIVPEAFTIVGDKLYLNYSLDIQKKWLADRDAYIAKADAKWPGLRDG